MENEINIIRPTWDQYFIKLAWLVAERSTCERHHVGAVIVRDKRILTTGYNGAASGIKDCLKLGCLRFPNPDKSVNVCALRGRDLSLGMVPPSTRNVGDDRPPFLYLAVPFPG